MKWLTSPKLCLVGLCLALSSCGFALRGVDNSILLDPKYKHVHIITNTTQDTLLLKQHLSKHLHTLGIDTQPAQSLASIELKNTHFRRYELAGTLTEVRLVLMADVAYNFKERSYTYPIQVERTYQYNEASVVGTDGQGDQVKAWLFDSLGERIAEQYRSLAQNQLP